MIGFKDIADYSILLGKEVILNTDYFLGLLPKGAEGIVTGLYEPLGEKYKGTDIRSLEITWTNNHEKHQNLKGVTDGFSPDELKYLKFKEPFLPRDLINMDRLVSKKVRVEEKAKYYQVGVIAETVSLENEAWSKLGLKGIDVYVGNGNNIFYTPDRWDKLTLI